MPRRKAAVAETPGKTSTEVVIPGTEMPLDLHDLSAQIVAELAAGLSDAKSIREQYGISEQQWGVLRRSPAFRAMLGEAVNVWRGDLNAAQRITKKAEILLEESLPVLDQIVHNALVVPSVRIDAIKQIESITGRKAKEAGGGVGGGGGFVLNINLAGGRQGITLEGHAVKEQSDE